MFFSSVRPLWQGFMSGLLALALLLPATSIAAERKSSGKKKPVAVKLAEKKRSSARVERVAESKKRSRKSVLASQVGKRQAREALRKESRDVVRTASKRQVRGAKTQTASARRAERSQRVARNDRRGHSRWIAQRSVRRDRPGVIRVAAAPRLTSGERLGLRDSGDPLSLNSSVALVLDQQTGEVLFSKNDSAVLPIASLTKLMTGLVIADAGLPMDEPITITWEDVDTHKGSSSRLAVGVTLTRGEMMHLALMSSENRAAHALGRTYPGGLAHFVRMMNTKARDLGMTDTRYVEPTGLMSQNQSSARDLAILVAVAYERPILRNLSTSPSQLLDVGNRVVEFRNSNRLINDPAWDIGLQKTGYISEAGRCLVMQARVAGRALIMVFLDSAGKVSRAQDAERIRHWVETQTLLRRVSARPQG